MLRAGAGAVAAPTPCGRAEEGGRGGGRERGQFYPVNFSTSRASRLFCSGANAESGQVTRPPASPRFWSSPPLPLCPNPNQPQN